MRVVYECYPHKFLQLRLVGNEFAQAGEGVKNAIRALATNSLSNELRSDPNMGTSRWISGDEEEIVGVPSTSSIAEASLPMAAANNSPAPYRAYRYLRAMPMP